MCKIHRKAGTQFMSSNEEYLDSLLKSVTAKEQSGNGGLSNQAEGESNIGNAAESSGSESLSSMDLEKMLAREESVGADMGEEKAFIDPGALFFASEEDEEGFEDSFLAIEDIPEDEEDIAADNLEEDPMTSVDSMEEDVMMVADNMEEDIMASTDSMEEDIVASADDMEEELMASADGMEEDVMASADDMEEDVMALADSMEEDVIASADSMEEDVMASADSMEEDVIASADSMEEDFIAMADSVEEMHDNAVFEDESFKEINDLLASSGDGDDDMFAMLEGVGNEEESAGIDIGFFDEEENNEVPVEETKKERKKREKKKRNKRNKKNAGEEGAETEENYDSEEGAEELVTIGEVEKKPGLFKRFIDFLMEEDEDEEETGKVRVPISEDDDLFVSEEVSENDSILQELSNEDASEKAQKEDKKKKKKGKKGKKGKDTDADSETEEESEEVEDKKQKKAKKEKKKKEKAIEDIIPEASGKKLSIKKIEVTAVFCLTILAAILLVVNLIPPSLEKNRARDAYYAKDYEKVVEGFYGEELSDSDSIMYNRAYTILRLQRKIDGYNNYMRMGKETEALNQLIEGVVRYKEIYPDAEKYNVTGEIDEIYQTIEDALENRYGISTTVAEGLYGMEDNLAYTLKLESIINGTEYVAPVYDEAEETETAEE